MKRQMIAYAAVLALLAGAVAPQIANAQSKPQNVTVVNPVSNPVKTSITNAVVPVEVSNANPIPVDVTGSVTAWDHFATMLLRTFEFGSGASDGTGDFTIDTVVTSLVVVAHLEAAEEDIFARCTVSASIGSQTVAFFKVLRDQQLVVPIPLPNVRVPAGTEFRVQVVNDFAGPHCEAVVQVQGTYLF